MISKGHRRRRAGFFAQVRVARVSEACLKKPNVGFDIEAEAGSLQVRFTASSSVRRAMDQPQLHRGLRSPRQVINARPDEVPSTMAARRRGIPIRAAARMVRGPPLSATRHARLPFPTPLRG